MVVINTNNKTAPMKSKRNTSSVCRASSGINFTSKKIPIIEITINKNKYYHPNVFVIAPPTKGSIPTANAIEELIIANAPGFSWSN